MTFHDDCKIEVAAYEISPDAWRAEVVISCISTGETLLPPTTVLDSVSTYPTAGGAQEAARAYAEAIIADGAFEADSKAA
ncbi:hypothetical protein GO998_06795 [Ralstonia syzygii]|uniref:Uncharacterized protein n=1 Tax=Ralstonia syzygii TaxID=28097 RepID=A0ABX7ZEJ2_9RALS|nr:hypothetical protein [Ralstonia syzygii]QUP53496.1 hypothetical protein GO998_06795 [Ralstonia syzygii]